MQPLTASYTLSCSPRILQHWILSNTYESIDDISIFIYIIYDNSDFVNT